MGQIREDMAVMKQAERKVQEVAKHYADKYKEANDVLKLRNTEKISLLQEKEELENKKMRWSSKCRN